MKQLLTLAAKIALAQSGSKKNFLLAAVVKRKDGAITVSSNCNTKRPDPSVHAEYRVLKKADVGCELFVARVTRDGQWAMAKPCKFCQARIRNRGVKRVYYTISPNEWCTWEVDKCKQP